MSIAEQYDQAFDARAIYDPHQELSELYDTARIMRSCPETSVVGTMYGGPQLLWYTPRSDLFSVYRTYFSELLNGTIIKSASAGASF